MPDLCQHPIRCDPSGHGEPRLLLDLSTQLGDDLRASHLVRGHMRGDAEAISLVPIEHKL